MAKHRVLERSFINNALVEEGTIVDFDGEAGPNLELIEEEPAPKKGGKKAADAPAADGEALV